MCDAVLVGCGNRAQVHAAALAGSDRYNLVAVCDLDREKAERTADEFGAPAVYTDLHEAIPEERPTHVSAVTPPTVRLGLISGVLDHEPASLLFEKPVANTLREVEEIRAACEAVDTRVTVCHQHIFGEEIRAVKRWVDEGRLGDVRRVVGTTKGGASEHGTHFVHLLNWLVGGRPETVRGFAEGPASIPLDTNEVSEPADVAVELSYPGVRAFVHLGENAPDVPEQAGTWWYEYTVTVTGTEGSASFVLGDHARGTFADGTETVDPPEFDEDAYMTTALYETLADCLDGERTDHPSDLAAAVDVHRTIDAGLRSAVEGRAVDTGESPPPLRTTSERLHDRLTARKPLAVTAAPFGGDLAPLADLGVTRAELTAGDGRDVAPTDHDLAVPVVRVPGDGDVAAGVDTAAAVGAETVVVPGQDPREGWDAETAAGWADRAGEADLTLALGNYAGGLDSVAAMTALRDALDHPAVGLALSPGHLADAGGSPREAVARLGRDLAVLELRDADPVAAWRDRGDAQVPGGGGAVDFAGLLDATLEHAPRAEWLLRFDGTDGWGRERAASAVARGLRFIDARRPR
jgi:predicted dehydrogenase/sugar phosphate isomerase/epimerase